MATPISIRQFLFSRLAGWLACLLLLLPGALLAETNVTGAITQNTTWTASQSPYHLLVDTLVDNGATLIIEAGVTVRLARGVSLTVKSGALQAAGSPASPVVITASGEATGSAAPGDWGQLRFLPGTVSASSFLENVQIKFGSGLVMEKASPTLNHVALQNHRGAAIAVDLASSPLGTGLSASGNDVNGIVVPAGTITGNVHWGLVGIPYLIAAGWVNVGQAPITLEPGALTLNPGVQGSLRVYVSTPAPVGGLTISLVSSVPSSVFVPASVTIPEGASWADLTLDALALGSATITASQAQRGSATARVEVANLPALQLLPGSATLGINRPLLMSVRLPEVAPAGGVSVTLSSSEPGKLSVPGSLNIPAGSQSAAFSVNGLADGDAIVLAQAAGYASATARLAVRSRALVLPLALTVAPGATTSVALGLTEPAPAGGLTVNLASSRTDVASVPASVLVPAGESRADFLLQGAGVGTASLTASASAYQPASSSVTVDSISIDLDPVGEVSVPQGVTAIRRIRLSKPAPGAGVSIALSSNDPAVVTVDPAEVFVPPGQTIATRSIGLRGVAKGAGDVVLTAAGLNGKTAKITVTDPAVLRLSSSWGSPAVVGKGLQSSVNLMYVERTVNGIAFASPEALTVTLACVSAAVCAAPASVTIPAGQSYVYFPLSGVEVGSSELLATAPGFGSATGFQIKVLNPTLEFGWLDGSRSLSSVRDDFYLGFSVPGSPTSQTALVDTVVSLVLGDQNPPGLVSGIYDAAEGGNAVAEVVIPAGSYQSYPRMRYVERPLATGSYSVTATVAGLATAVSAVQTVTSPALRLSSPWGSPAVVGKGLLSSTSLMYVERTVNGRAFESPEALTVTLACVSAAVCAAPASVTIPAGQSYVYFPLSGVEVGSSELLATAPGFGSATGFQIKVLNPTLEFGWLDGSRSLSSVRDDFYLGFSVPGSPTSQTALVDTVVSLVLGDQNPPGLVSGIYDAAEGGNAVAEVVIPAGSYQSYPRMRYVERPLATGSYSVTATVAGLATAVSAVQTVTSPVLRLSSSWGSPAVLGKGLRSHANLMYVERTVNGIAFNGAEALTVSLACGSAAVCLVPATVTIPAGQSYAMFNATGVDPGDTLITASAAGYADAPGFPTSVVLPVFQINYWPTALAPGASADFVVGISAPGASPGQTAANPITVTLSNAVPGVADIPATVVIPLYSAQSPGVPVRGVSPGETSVTASAPGVIAQTSATLRVLP